MPMRVQFDVTRRFEKDLSSLSRDEQRRVAASVDGIRTIGVEQGAKLKKLYRPHVAEVPSDYESSLYVLRVTPTIRVVLTIEDDPLFGRMLVTLFRVVRRDEANRALHSVAESLYQEFAATSHGGRQR